MHHPWFCLTWSFWSLDIKKAAVWRIWMPNLPRIGWRSGEESHLEPPLSLDQQQLPAWFIAGNVLNRDGDECISLIWRSLSNNKKTGTYYNADAWYSVHGTVSEWLRVYTLAIFFRIVHFCPINFFYTAFCNVGANDCHAFHKDNKTSIGSTYAVSIHYCGGELDTAIYK